MYYIINMLVLFFLFAYQTTYDLQTAYTNLINPIITFFINSIGIEAIHSNINILLPSVTFKVLFGCNGLEALLIFSAGVIAFNTNLQYKLKYLIQGIAIISLINIFRVVILAYIVEYHNQYFNIMHDYITQDIMIFLAIILFLIFTHNAKIINSKGRI